MQADMGRIVKIDTTKWTTTWRFAKEKQVSRQVVNNWIRRGKIEAKYIEELDLKLVKI